jgi:hypothetical protein
MKVKLLLSFHVYDVLRIAVGSAILFRNAPFWLVGVKFNPTNQPTNFTKLKDDLRKISANCRKITVIRPMAVKEISPSLVTCKAPSTHVLVQL